MSYRSKGERKLATWARDRGWEQGERNGMGHIVMCWPASGARVPIPSKAEGRALTNAKAMLQRTELHGTSRPAEKT